MQSPTTTIDLDSRTDSMIRLLMGPLRETSKEGVIRKAVALMKQVVEISQDQRFFILENPNGQKTKIWLD
jgi:predicted transcriptional regulator